MRAKWMKKTCGLLLAVSMAAGMSGCGQEAGTGGDKNGAGSAPETASGQSQSQENKEETKDPVTLEWYYRGNGVQKDTQSVEDAVNDLLKNYEGLEHVTIHMNPFASADYANGVLLAQTSGKQIDILNTVGLDFVTEVRNETFLALDDYLNSERFAGLKAELPEWLWALGGVEGSTYIVPNYQRGANRQYLELPAVYQQYTDVDKLRKMLVDESVPIEDLAAEIEKIVLAVREAEGVDTKYVFGLPGMVTLKEGLGGYKENLANGGFVMFAGETQVKNIYLDETYKKACEIVADWYERGLIPADMLVRQKSDYIKENMLNEEAIPVHFDQGYGDEATASANFTRSHGFDAIALPLHEKYFMANAWGAGGNGVTASCEHPEEAVAFLEALTTERGKEIYNTIVYGLEGVHYEKLDEKHIRTLEYDEAQGSGETSYAALKWIIGNTFHAYLNQGCLDGDNEIALEINENPENLISPAMGFRLDTEPVATEIEQCSAVVAEYKDTLEWGAKGSKWQAYYDEFVRKLEAAGYQKVIDEIQAQYDAWNQ